MSELGRTEHGLFSLLYPVTDNLTAMLTFSRMAELVEKETEAWYKMDPDPFDDRHPGI